MSEVAAQERLQVRILLRDLQKGGLPGGQPRLLSNWRRRRNAITLTPFDELRPAARRRVRQAAERYAAPADLEVTFAAP